jgi:GT2 family glycosyltransferase
MTGSSPLPMAVVVVSFNTRGALESCLESVVAAAPTEMVVVDNGSTDGSIELVRSAFPDIRLLVNAQNRGYGSAANLAIAACSAPAVLLLNSDTVLAPDAPLALGRYVAEHPRAAVVGPRLANTDGTLQPSTRPFRSVADVLMGDVGLESVVRRIPGLRARFLRTWSHDVARTVPWVVGAALAVRRSAFESVGGFDERYFMYWEEVDLCRRLADAGFETHFAPVTTVVHAGAASTTSQPAGVRRAWLIGQRRYLRQHEPRRKAAVILSTLRALALAQVGRDALHARVTRSSWERERLHRSLADAKARLAERCLWRP